MLSLQALDTFLRWRISDFEGFSEKLLLRNGFVLRILIKPLGGELSWWVAGSKMHALQRGSQWVYPESSRIYILAMVKRWIRLTLGDGFIPHMVWPRHICWIRWNCRDGRQVSLRGCSFWMVLALKELDEGKTQRKTQESYLFNSIFIYYSRSTVVSCMDFPLNPSFGTTKT